MNTLVASFLLELLFIPAGINDDHKDLGDFGIRPDHISDNSVRYLPWFLSTLILTRQSAHSNLTWFILSSNKAYDPEEFFVKLHNKFN